MSEQATREGATDDLWALDLTVPLAPDEVCARLRDAAEATESDPGVSPVLVTIEADGALGVAQMRLGPKEPRMRREMPIELRFAGQIDAAPEGTHVHGAIDAATRERYRLERGGFLAVVIGLALVAVIALLADAAVFVPLILTMGVLIGGSLAWRWNAIHSYPDALLDWIAAALGVPRPHPQ